MTDILDLDARAQLAAMAGGRLSAEELMHATLARIAAVNPALNALVSLRAEETLLAEARAADAARSAGRAGGALHGLPIAIKDLSDAEGLPTSRGSPLFAGQVARRDELFVARLRAAGAIFPGKSNTPEFGLGGHTFNPVFGPTRNPFDPARSAGGSSGGAAVALATGMLALADGSDMMGSLRTPAAWCNVYGLRPSWGRVPDLPEGETFLHPVATAGPMARNPGDLALLLSVMAGPVPGRPFCLPGFELAEMPAPGLRGRRIGWLGDWGGALPMEPGLLSLSEAALLRMEAGGAIVEPVAPPLPREEIWQAWTTLRAFAVASRLGPLHADPARRAQMKATACWEVEKGKALTLAEVERASLVRSRLLAGLVPVFARLDALALPATQVWPFPLAQEYPTEIAGVAMDSYHRWMEVVVMASLAGLPAMSVPAGFGEQGLPGGLQLVGPPGGEGGLLALAEGWHRAEGPPARPPL